ncbi:hypothetical protein EC988_003276 [Linderina pennispora]|nr:hypothetical protein EC988_003276 [Linderina pennispora]
MIFIAFLIIPAFIVMWGVLRGCMIRRATKRQAELPQSRPAPLRHVTVLNPAFAQPVQYPPPVASHYSRRSIETDILPVYNPPSRSPVLKDDPPAYSTLTAPPLSMQMTA